MGKVRVRSANISICLHLVPDCFGGLGFKREFLNNNLFFMYLIFIFGPITKIFVD